MPPRHPHPQVEATRSGTIHPGIEISCIEFEDYHNKRIEQLMEMRFKNVHLLLL